MDNALDAQPRILFNSGHAEAFDASNPTSMDEPTDKMRRAAADAFMSSFEPVISRASTALTSREIAALREAVRLWAYAMLEAADVRADERKWFAGFGATSEEREMLVFLYKTRNSLVPADHQRFVDRVVKALEVRILELTTL